jgi:hypothetical protein
LASSLRTTPGTRRTWSTGRQWAKHLRDLLRRTGTKAKVYTDLEAHMVACDRAFIREQNMEGLLALQAVLRTPKAQHDERVRPPRGQRGGSAYVLITDEVHNALQNAEMKRRRYEHQRRELYRFHRQLLLFPLFGTEPIQEAA